MKHHFLSLKTLVLIFILFSLFVLVNVILEMINSQVKVTGGFNVNKTDYYSFEKMDFSYNLLNAGNRNLADVTSVVNLCNLGKTSCKIVYTDTESILGAQKMLTKTGQVALKEVTDFGLKSVVFTVFLKSKPGKILAQQEQTITVNNLASELFLNLTTNGDFFNSGDIVKLKYNFKNQSKINLPRDDFALTLNYAGPVEKAAGTGILIEDLSKDLDIDETVKGEAPWVLTDFPNRLGGIYNVSLYFAYKNDDGKLLRIADIVRQIQWP